MKQAQKKTYDDIASAVSLSTPFEKIAVEDTPTFLKEPIAVADFAVGVVGAAGASAAELGEARGLPSQDVAVDRRRREVEIWQHERIGTQMLTPFPIYPGGGF